MDRPYGNPLSPTWFSERMKQEEDARRREAFGAAEDDEVEKDSLADTHDNYIAFLRRIATETFEDVAMVVFDEAFDLLVARQRKYGPGNIETLGQYGVFTRMEDKMERIRHSMNGKLVDGQVVLDEAAEHSDESLDDADLDLMNYAAIRLIHRRGLWGKPLAEDAGFSQ